VNITQLLIVATIVGLIAYDVIAGANGQPTESAVLRDWSVRWTLLPFVAGFLSSHWFAPRAHADVSGWMWALPAMVILLGIDLVWNLKGLPRVWWRYPYLYFILGVPVGYFFWPQPL